MTKRDSLRVLAQATGTAAPLLHQRFPSRWRRSSIRRRDGLQTVTAQAEFAPGASAAEVVVRLRATSWPPRRPAGSRFPIRVRRAGGDHRGEQPVARAADYRWPGPSSCCCPLAQFHSFRRTTIMLLETTPGLTSVDAGPAAHGVLPLIHTPAGHRRAGRDPDLQRDRSGAAARRRRNELGERGARPAGDRHHYGRTAGALVRGWPDVGIHGHPHHLRFAADDSADPRRAAPVLLRVLLRFAWRLTEEERGKATDYRHPATATAVTLRGVCPRPGVEEDRQLHPLSQLVLRYA